MLGVLNPATMDERLDGYMSPGCFWQGTYICADLYFRGTMEEFEEAFLAPLARFPPRAPAKLPRALLLVGGAGRSGTTWLRAALDRHPSIACGPELRRIV